MRQLAPVILLLSLGQAITTDFYQAEPSRFGTLDFYSPDGRKLIEDLARFEAHFFADNSHHTLVPDSAVVPEILDWGDSVLVLSSHDLRLVRLDYRYRLARNSPLIECRLDVTYERAIDSVFFETLQADVFAEKAVVVTRDLRLTEAGKAETYVSDRWTTRAARFGRGQESVTFPGEDNMQGMRLSWQGYRWRVAYDLDRQMNHPICRNYLPPGVYETLAANSRREGEQRTYFFRLTIGEWQPIIRRMRQSHGFEATVVMTEHADCEGPATSKAIAYGRSDVNAPIPGRGILGNGLTWTKTVFEWHTYGSRDANQGYYGLDRPDFKAVIDSLYRRGVEIGLHTPTALVDSADTVAVSLRDMRNWYRSRVWIDHAADHNYEDIAKFGTYADSTSWYIAETLARYGFDYVWQMNEAHWGGNDLFVPQVRDYYPLVLYNGTRLDEICRRPFFFWGSIPINTNEERDNHISPQAVKRLIDQRGVDIMHLYFAAQDSTVSRRRPSWADWLVRSGTWPIYTWESDSWVDGCLQNMASQQRAGRLRVNTLSDFADYLLLSDSVELISGGRLGWRVVNRSHMPVSGFALAVEAEGIREIKIDGTTVANTKRVGKDIIFWFDVPADTTLRLEFTMPDFVYSRSATAPAQNRHIVHFGNRRYAILTQGRQIVFRSSHDDGETWSEPVRLGTGSAPALMLSQDSMAVVSYDSASHLRVRKLTGSDWQDITPAIDTNWSLANGGALAVSRIADDAQGDIFYLFYPAVSRERKSNRAFSDNESTVGIDNKPEYARLNCLRLCAFDEQTTYFDTAVVGPIQGAAYCCPSIAVVPADLLHFAWCHVSDSLDARVFYRTIEEPLTPSQVRAGRTPVWSPTIEVTEPGTVRRVGEKPVVTSAGDSVICVWQGLNARGQPVGEIYRRRRSLFAPADSWTWIQNISQSPTQSSLSPMASGQVVVWEEEQTGICGVVGNEYLTFAQGTGLEKNPQTDVRWRSAFQPSVVTMWLELMNRDSLWEIRTQTHKTVFPEEFISYSVTCGESAASPYCVYRSGYDSGSDIGLDSLIYDLRWLEPRAGYSLRCCFLVPETTTQYLYLDDSLMAEAFLLPAECESITLFVPQEFYQRKCAVRLRIAAVIHWYS